MKEAIVSVLALLAVATIRCSELGKDGFNYYKDYLRARSDEAMLEEPSPGERMLYFYRTPLQLYPGLLPAIEQEYRKRTGNVFKMRMVEFLCSNVLISGEDGYQDVACGLNSNANAAFLGDHMLSKDSLAQYEKRSSKAALSLMLQGKQGPYYANVGHYCPFGK